MIPRVERIAVVDMGSNSWRLVVFGYEPDTPWWSLVDEIREAVRIGAGMGDEQLLQPERVEQVGELWTVLAAPLGRVKRQQGTDDAIFCAHGCIRSGRA